MKRFLPARKAPLFVLLMMSAAGCLCARAARSQISTQDPAAKIANCATSTVVAEAAQRLELHGVPNFGKVTATLYRGGQPSKKGFAELKKLGVQIIVNLRDDNSEAERSLVTAAGLEYVAIPWSCHHPANSLAAKFLQVLGENPEKKTFVHCHAGVDRTGLMIAVYRMTEQGWTPEQASDEMKAFGFNFFHRSWCHALEDYEQNFPRQLTADPDLRPFQAGRSAPSPCTP